MEDKKFPINAWRVLPNPRCNDWNDEPEYCIVPYIVLGEDGDKFLVERKGWHGKKRQHYIKNGDFYFIKGVAEVELYEKNWHKKMTQSEIYDFLLKREGQFDDHS